MFRERILVADVVALGVLSEPPVGVDAAAAEIKFCYLCLVQAGYQGTLKIFKIHHKKSIEMHGKE